MSTAQDIEVKHALDEFFTYLFEMDNGYVCIATMRPPLRRDTFNEFYFKWPIQRIQLVDFIYDHIETHNLYFCVNLLSTNKRLKDNALPLNLVWADLDTCAPSALEIPPQLVIESSPGHYQSIWRVDKRLDAPVASDYSKRIAYKYLDNGADKGGHDLTQLLRVPYTYNFKYEDPEADTPRVRVMAMVQGLLPEAVFAELPKAVIVDTLTPDVPVPDLRILPNPEMIIHRYSDQLRYLNLATAFARYYSEEPSSDWSGHLWRLLSLCFEVGMTADETFVIAKHAKSNKYERDNRPDAHLWREILKKELEHKTIETLLQDHRYLAFPSLITQEEKEALQPTIIDTYCEWAGKATDAVPEFHEVGAMMILSSLMATTLRLKTTRPKDIIPNLWSLILGESTITRKTTAMEMALDFVIQIDPTLLISTDTSPEGMMRAVSLRPSRVSIFYRDEIAGLFGQMQTREYMAGLQELMAALYDAPKYMTRTLRKETFTVSEPIFVFFGGGVPEKMYSIVDEAYFESGFIPRFLIMRGYGDSNRMVATGPPIMSEPYKRADLLSTFSALYEIYTNQSAVIELPSGDKILTTPTVDVELTEETWQRSAHIELQMTQAAQDSPEYARALPMFSRMFVSLLKMTMLLAAARQDPVEGKVTAELRDLLRAAYYIERWGRHAVEMIRNSGVTADESKLMRVYRQIEQNPGVMRSALMRRHRLTSREMGVIEDTLNQRAMIQIQHMGSKARKYWAIGR